MRENYLGAVGQFVCPRSIYNGHFNCPLLGKRIVDVLAHFHGPSSLLCNLKTEKCEWRGTTIDSSCVYDNR